MLRQILFAVLLMTGLPLAAAPRILVVTATTGFRHESIETAEGVLSALAAMQGIELLFARDEAEMLERMTPTALQDLTAVFCVNTTGDLPAAALRALLDWVQGGGTFAGFHSASDTWHGSSDYIAMLGAEFASHPADFDATIVVNDSMHPATRNLPPSHTMLEEIYSFTNFDASRVRMLLSLRDPAQPLAWEKSYGRGRVLYSALGHRLDVWTSPWFQAHVGGVLEWTLTPLVHLPKRRAVRP
jgi:type 1 glutamine amidotransferase